MKENRTRTATGLSSSFLLVHTKDMEPPQQRHLHPVFVAVLTQEPGHRMNLNVHQKASGWRKCGMDKQKCYANLKRKEIFSSVTRQMKMGHLAK